MIISAIGLSVPVILRGVFNLFNIYKPFNDLVLNNYYIAVIIVTIIGKFLTILCQATSLVFGFIR